MTGGCFSGDKTIVLTDCTLNTYLSKSEGSKVLTTIAVAYKKGIDKENNTIARGIPMLSFIRHSDPKICHASNEE